MAWSPQVSRYSARTVRKADQQFEAPLLDSAQGPQLGSTLNWEAIAVSHVTRRASCNIAAAQRLTLAAEAFYPRRGKRKNERKVKEFNLKKLKKVQSAWCPSAEKQKTPLQHASIVCDGEPGRTNPELSGFSPCKSAMRQATTPSKPPLHCFDAGSGQIHGQPRHV